jgi:hypothetical protein
MLIFWILFFEVAMLYFACTVPLKSRSVLAQGGVAVVRDDAAGR